MDLANNGPNPVPNNVDRTNIQVSRGNQKPHKEEVSWYNNEFFRLIQSVLALCILVVVVGLLVFLVINNTTSKSEINYLNQNGVQAVVLTTGQVYYGNIKNISNNYLTLNNVFYPQSTNTANTGSNPASIVKFGCNTASAYDQLIINDSSLAYWENLSPSSQVAKSISSWDSGNSSFKACSNQGVPNATVQNNSSKRQG